MTLHDDSGSRFALTRRAALQVGSASALGAFIAACSSSGPHVSTAPKGKPTRGGTLVYPTTLDARTLDPAFSAEYSERFIYYAVYDSLVAYDENFNIVPGLARHWKLTDGGRKITFYLQPHVKFTDGTDCDAAAVKFNLDRILDPATNSPMRAQLTPPLQKVVVLDKTTVQLQLSEPWRPLLASLGERPGFIVSPTAVKKYGKDYGAHAVGSGPFKVASYTPGNQITMIRNDSYWQKGRPYLDKVQMTNAPDASVQLTQLRTNQAQIVTNLDPSLLPTIQGASGVKIKSKKGGHWFMCSVLESKPPFDNLKLRQAMAHASNRNGVLNAVYHGKGRIATNPIGIGWAFDPNMDVTYPYDIAAAKKLVSEAGLKGMTIPFTSSSETTYEAVSQVLLSGYQKMGLNVKYQTVPSADYYSEVKAGKIIWSAGEWTPRADPDGLLRILFYSTGFQNTTGYKNPRVDHLLDQAAQIFDTKKAAPLYYEIEKLIAEDANSVSLVWPNYILAERQNLHNAFPPPDGILRFGQIWMS